MPKIKQMVIIKKKQNKTMAAMEAAAPVHSRQLHLPIDIQENKVKNKKKKKSKCFTRKNSKAISGNE